MDWGKNVKKTRTALVMVHGTRSCAARLGALCIKRSQSVQYTTAQTAQDNVAGSSHRLQWAAVRVEADPTAAAAAVDPDNDMLSVVGGVETGTGLTDKTGSEGDGETNTSVDTTRPWGSSKVIEA